MQGVTQGRPALDGAMDADALLASIDLLALTGADPRPAAHTNGGEHKGPCPLCGGHDRLAVWPRHPSGRGRWWCRQCGQGGDAIDLVRTRDGLTFPEAVRALGGDPAAMSRCRPAPGSVQAPAVSRPPEPPRPSDPPSTAWQARATAIAERARARLWEPDSWALGELRRRGFSDEVIRSAGLGDVAKGWRDPGRLWGLGEEMRVWIPRGILIPWVAGGQLWRLNIRRPSEDGDPKYIGPAGWTNSLYNVDAVRPDRPVIMVEGELDALTIQQAAGDLVTPVATGSAVGGRVLRWIARLATASAVLVAFDADPPGDRAVAYWTDVLPNARRWRPYWSDANAMATGGADLRGWISAALPPGPGDQITAEEAQELAGELGAALVPLEAPA